MNTREIIVDKALKMFNERGIEYVGLRELASELDIRVSNISYYFPTKDDLVNELSIRLSKANASIIIEDKHLSMKGFMEMLDQVYQNHVRYRCLLLSVVHLMQQNKHMAAKYKQTQNIRNATLQSNLQALEENGYLKIKDEDQMRFLVSTLSLISRFWISEAAISFRNQAVSGQVNFYLQLVAQLFQPYCTARGRSEIQMFIESRI